MSTCWPVCSGLRLVCSRRVEVGWASSTADAQGGDEDGATPDAEDAEVHLRVPEVRAQLSTLPSIREVDVDIAEEDMACGTGSGRWVRPAAARLAQGSSPPAPQLRAGREGATSGPVPTSTLMSASGTPGVGGRSTRAREGRARRTGRGVDRMAGRSTRKGLSGLGIGPRVHPLPSARAAALGPPRGRRGVVVKGHQLPDSGVEFPAL